MKNGWLRGFVAFALLTVLAIVCVPEAALAEVKEIERSNPLIMPAANLPPVSPTNITATVISDIQINLTWRDNSNNEAGFQIQRMISCGPGTGGVYIVVGEVPANVTRFTDVGVAPSSCYTYRVYAFTGTGINQRLSDFFTSAFPVTPAGPQRIYRSAQYKPTWRGTLNAVRTGAPPPGGRWGVNLTWTGSGDPGNYFLIYRTGGGMGTMLFRVAVPSNVAGFTDFDFLGMGLRAKSTYTYTIYPYNWRYDVLGGGFPSIQVNIP